MIYPSRTGRLAIELGERLAVSHIAFENGPDLARLTIAEYPGSATFVEKEVHLFKCLLCCFLVWC